VAHAARGWRLASSQACALEGVRLHAAVLRVAVWRCHATQLRGSASQVSDMQAGGGTPRGVEPGAPWWRRPSYANVRGRACRGGCGGRAGQVVDHNSGVAISQFRGLTWTCRRSKLAVRFWVSLWGGAWGGASFRPSVLNRLEFRERFRPESSGYSANFHLLLTNLRSSSYVSNRSPGVLLGFHLQLAGPIAPPVSSSCPLGAILTYRWSWSFYTLDSPRRRENCEITRPERTFLTRHDPKQPPAHQ
jgi:hypothetical protein